MTQTAPATRNPITRSKPTRAPAGFLLVGLMLSGLGLAAIAPTPPVAQNYALVNAGDWHLRWEVECVPDGVTFTAAAGVIAPHSAETIAHWSATQPGDTPPDVMAGVRRRHYADPDDLRRWVECYSGPGICAAWECWWFDFDADGDVDQADFGHAQSLLEAR